MGAWGSGPFDNDDALDWVASFVDAEDGLSGGQSDEPGKIDLVVGPLAIAAGGMDDEDDDEDGEGGEGAGGGGEGDFIEIDLASHAIAAAEVIAAVRGKAHPDLAADRPALNDTLDDDDVLGDEGDEGEDGESGGGGGDGGDSLRLIAKWVKSGSEDHETLRDEGVREVAIQALERIRDESELAELWGDAEPDDAKAWKDHLEGLIKRLGG